MKVSITNKEGIELSAELDMPPSGKAGQYAIFAHCFTCSKSFSATRNISRSLTMQGFGVLRFDFTGLGNSQGEFGDSNFSANLADIKTVATWLEENHQAPNLLVGHSLGGAAALFAGAQIASIKAIATVGAPADPVHVEHLFGDNLGELKEKGAAQVNIGGRPFQVKGQFLEDLRTHDIERVLPEMRKALLFMHSPQDTIVSIKNAARLYSLAHHPKSFVSLDGADHLLSKKADSMYVGSVIANWAERYLAIKDDALPEGRVEALLQSETFTTAISVGEHHMIADEPKSVGGHNLGPTPYDYVASGLGACTAMTIKMYAARKKWNVTGIKVAVTHDKKYAQDCAECEQPRTKIDHFNRVIDLSGDLDDSQRKRLLEIANKCPVHKTLEASSVIETELAQV